MTGKKQTVLRTEQLKAFYLLEMHGTQKIVKAVNDVDLTIYENEIYGIAGESGCGKTTLLKALFNDFVPPLRLISGKIYYRINWEEEVDVTSMSPEEMRQAAHGVHLLYSARLDERAQSGAQAERRPMRISLAAISASRAGKKPSNWLASRSWRWAYPKISSSSTHTSYRVECASV
jgi:ABC-type glutathione transport system ATPase component